jgi:hypothetical protein
MLACGGPAAVHWQTSMPRLMRGFCSPAKIKNGTQGNKDFAALRTPLEQSTSNRME